MLCVQIHTQGDRYDLVWLQELLQEPFWELRNFPFPCLSLHVSFPFVQTGLFYNINLSWNPSTLFRSSRTSLYFVHRILITAVVPRCNVRANISLPCLFVTLIQMCWNHKQKLAKGTVIWRFSSRVWILVLPSFWSCLVTKAHHTPWCFYSVQQCFKFLKFPPSELMFWVVLCRVVTKSRGAYIQEALRVSHTWQRSGVCYTYIDPEKQLLCSSVVHLLF